MGPCASGPAVNRGGSRGTSKSRAKAAAAFSADDHLRFRQAANLRDSNGSCEDQLDRRRETQDRHSECCFQGDAIVLVSQSGIVLLNRHAAVELNLQESERSNSLAFTTASRRNPCARLARIERVQSKRLRICW